MDKSIACNKSHFIIYAFPLGRVIIKFRVDKRFLLFIFLQQGLFNVKLILRKL